MRMVKRNRNRRRSGFTLLEVLIVVGILALLAAFVVPNLMGTQKSAKVTATESMIGPSGALATALDLYRVAMNTYPEELSELTEVPDDDELAEKWNGPYITNPDDLRDAWQNDLNYRCPGEVNEEGYDLWSNGPDGDEDSDDDIKNWKDDA